MKQKGKDDVQVGSLELSVEVGDKSVKFSSKSDLKISVQGMAMSLSDSFKSICEKNKTLTLTSFNSTMKYDAMGKKESSMPSPGSLIPP